MADRAAQLLWLSASAIPAYLVLLFLTGVSQIGLIALILMALPSIGFSISSTYLAAASRSEEPWDTDVGVLWLVTSALGGLASIFYLLATVGR